MIHGILTGKTKATWAQWGRAWFASFAPTIRCLTETYFELPFPRIAALRNRKRIPQIADGYVLHSDLTEATTGRRPMISICGHSNGGFLTLGVARELIERGYILRRIVLMAPAVRTKQASDEVAQWIVSGKLGGALLVRAMEDRTIGLVSRFKILCFPWGALGLEGWVKPLRQMETIDLPCGHTEFLSDERREETFREIIAPYLGVEPPPLNDHG